MTLRLFLAVPIPASVVARLIPLQRDLPGASWREPQDLHLTLRFLGVIDESQARDVDSELGRIEAAPFELRLKGVGSFGGREPSAVWAGVDAPQDLQRLAQACDRAVRRAGLPAEARAFLPHVTLAYLKGARDVEVAAYQGRLGAFVTERFWVDHFVMFSSWGTKRGSRYVEEAVYPLTGAAKSAFG